jgi:hypothetical protein
MHEQIITIYYLCDNFLGAWGQKDDPQARMTTAEVRTTVRVAAAFFCGNQERSRVFRKTFGFLPRMLSKGRLNRRLHAIGEATWQALFALLAQAHQQAHDGQAYCVDRLPVPVCDNIRIQRCKFYRQEDGRPDEAYRGYTASKRRYFFGLKVHLLITATGQPVEFVLTPGSEADIRAFKRLPLNLPEGVALFGDTAYTDYTEEALLSEEANIRLLVPRRKSSLWPHPGWLEYIGKQTRKRVETTFSQIEKEFARHIHAVTPRGFELKVFLTLLAYSIFA